MNTPDGAGFAMVGSLLGSTRITRVPQTMFEVRGWESAERTAGGRGCGT